MNEKEKDKLFKAILGVNAKSNLPFLWQHKEQIHKAIFGMSSEERIKELEKDL